MIRVIEKKKKEREPERAIMYNYSIVECVKKQTIFKNLKIFGSILQIRRKFDFLGKFLYFQSLSVLKNPIAQSFGKKYGKNDVRFSPDRMG